MDYTAFFWAQKSCNSRPCCRLTLTICGYANGRGFKWLLRTLSLTYFAREQSFTEKLKYIRNTSFYLKWFLTFVYLFIVKSEHKKEIERVRKNNENDKKALKTTIEDLKKQVNDLKHLDYLVESCDHFDKNAEGNISNFER